MAVVRRLIVADAHLGQRSGDVAAMVALLERAAAGRVGEVVFLGDAFQYLVGMSKLWTSAVREVLAVWARLRQGGLRVVVVEGNRDFFLDEPELAVQLDWSGRLYELTAGGRRFRLQHGDRVNRRDLQYRFWAAVSKSTPARVWARLLPRRLAVSIVRSMEARLARTNRRYRYVKPVEDLRRAAATAWAEGVDVMLWGHFHSFWEYREGDRLAMVAPGWLESRTALLVEADGAWAWVGPSLTGSDAAVTIARTDEPGHRGAEPPPGRDPPSG